MFFRPSPRPSISHFIWSPALNQVPFRTILSSSIPQALCITPAKTAGSSHRKNILESSINFYGSMPSLRPFHPALLMDISEFGFNGIVLSGCTCGSGWFNIFCSNPHEQDGSTHSRRGVVDLEKRGPRVGHHDMPQAVAYTDSAKPLEEISVFPESTVKYSNPGSSPQGTTYIHSAEPSEETSGFPESKVMSLSQAHRNMEWKNCALGWRKSFAGRNSTVLSDLHKSNRIPIWRKKESGRSDPTGCVNTPRSHQKSRLQDQSWAEVATTPPYPNFCNVSITVAKWETERFE